MIQTVSVTYRTDRPRVLEIAGVSNGVPLLAVIEWGSLAEVAEFAKAMQPVIAEMLHVAASIPPAETSPIRS